VIKVIARNKGKKLKGIEGNAISLIAHRHTLARFTFIVLFLKLLPGGRFGAFYGLGMSDFLELFVV